MHGVVLSRELRSFRSSQEHRTPPLIFLDTDPYSWLDATFHWNRPSTYNNKNTSVEKDGDSDLEQIKDDIREFTLYCVFRVPQKRT